MTTFEGAESKTKEIIYDFHSFDDAFLILKLFEENFYCVTMGYAFPYS